MANLTVVAGGLPPRRRFSMNARGIAKYMVSGPYAQRKVIEDYAFPKEEKPKIILPAPAKDVVWKYFKSGANAAKLQNIIDELSAKPIDEKPYTRSRRTAALNAAKVLLKFGPTLTFKDIVKKQCDITIEGVPVRASIDFFCKVPDDRAVGVIFNVAAGVSDNKSQLDHYAEVECEIAWQATRLDMPFVLEIWYIDLLSETIVRKHKKSLKGAWRNIETTADNILIAYNALLARRARQRRA